MRPSYRLVSSVLVIIAGLVSSSCSCQETKPATAVQSTGRPEAVDCSCIGDHNIDVGSNVSCKLPILHSNAKGNGNVVAWKSTVSGMGVKIVFDNSPFDQPLNCNGSQNVCHSGALRTSISGDPAAQFAYHAWLCDKDMKCGQELDPGIIIVP